MKQLSKIFLTIAFSILSAGGAIAGTTGVIGNNNSESDNRTPFIVSEKYNPWEDGVIKAAELHYPRIPQEYWDHRIKMCKALGMNTICLYTFWNIHEQTPDKFNFEGQNDLRKFILLCKENDMKVILRPGPYVCAEWEMGGLPWWLLKKKDIALRENDPYFLERVDKFQKAIADQVGDLTIDNGGPIVMIQVENEYGSYGKNKEYVANIRDMLRKNFGEDITMFQCDWSSNFLDNGLDDLVWTLNFGTGADIDSQFEPLRKVRPNTPLMCSEYWSGWFDKWGAEHETRPADEMISGIKEMLDKDISFSLYMTHGGTNWGHWAGANSPGYAPDVTSYDYDAPINEQGAATPKYHALRKIMAKYSDKKLPSIPKPIPTVEIKQFDFDSVAPLFSNLPTPITDRDIHSMEDYDQGYGSIMYSTILPATTSNSLLTVNEPHDYARIYIDNKYIGTIDRRLGEKSLMIPQLKGGEQLDIFVEAMGRINFGRAIKDYKGITERVELTEERGGYKFTCDLKNWKVYLFPADSIPDASTSLVKIPMEESAKSGERIPGTYHTTFTVDKPGDTFLDMSNWGKGLVWVNGHPIGRFWEIGPQQTLYMPGCWLNKGENEITVFDIIGPREATIKGLKRPILDKLNNKVEQSHYEETNKPDITDITPDYTILSEEGNGWKRTNFGKTYTGRYLTLAFSDSYEDNGNIAIAELYLLDSKGQRYPRESWKVIWADSEEFSGNHTADKAFDLQESTYWTTTEESSGPHTISIDLGKEYSIGGIEILPRMESGAPGAPRTVLVFCR